MKTPFAPVHHPIGIYPVVDTVALLVRLAPYVTTIQLRIKTNNEAVVNQAIQQATATAQRHKLQLFINDYWRQALAFGAYGVHLGQGDITQADVHALKKAGIRLGVSTHTEEEIDIAYRYAPSYIAFGPVFFTHSKIMPYEPLGVAQLSAWCEQARTRNTPCVAIGGIGKHNIAAVAQASPNGIAMISAITHNNTPEKNLVALQKMVST